MRLHEVGKDPNEFAVVFAARAVRSGRRLCGQEKSKDVLSALAQRRRGFRVETLPSSTCTSQEQLYAQPHGQQMQDAFEERLQDNRQTPIPEQVAFRMDWPRYFNSLTPRDRQLAEYLSLGHSAKSAAAKFGVSPARVTQLRQRWCHEWRQFEEAEPVEA